MSKENNNIKVKSALYNNDEKYKIITEIGKLVAEQPYLRINFVLDMFFEIGLYSIIPYPMSQVVKVHYMEKTNSDGLYINGNHITSINVDFDYDEVDPLIDAINNSKPIFAYANEVLLFKFLMEED